MASPAQSKERARAKRVNTTGSALLLGAGQPGHGKDLKTFSHSDREPAKVKCVKTSCFSVTL